MSDHPVATAAMNLTAGATVIGSLIGWLPSIAALLGIIWYCILIYDRFFKRS